ncbi:hypothetical protein GOBAR_AA17044 [Gossypium barbadense]|uniref:Uncharacterized protein n=1 Tax=Gossypium barbadense TaxID=3634 RepID=A0A2P5XJU8_GOSBA|nr:hypothetical protein GOBAR_AA17044 [Gossypium barbadense]
MDGLRGGTGDEMWRNVFVSLLFGRLGEMILGRVGSSVPLDHPHAKHARDALWRHLADEGLYEPVLRSKVCQHFKGDKCMWRLRACSSFSSRNSSVYRPRAAPNFRILSWWINPPRQNWIVPGSSYLIIMVWRWNVENSFIMSSRYVGSITQRTAPKGRWLGELESRQPFGLVLRQPSRCSGPQLRVEPEVFGSVLPGAFGKTVREGDGFLWLGPRKRTLPSSSTK